MSKQQIGVGDMVEVVTVAGVPGDAHSGAVGTVIRIMGDLVRLRVNGGTEVVVVQRRVRPITGAAA